VLFRSLNGEGRKEDLIVCMYVNLVRSPLGWLFFDGWMDGTVPLLSNEYYGVRYLFGRSFASSAWDGM
jgi:hypothetical protein